jgi:D-tyrosyl-tRNA(Tyr) deacylase
MKCVIQRVSRATLTLQSGSLKNQQHLVASQQPHFSSTIGAGMVALIGIEKNDNIQDVEYMVKKLLTLRLWPNNETGKQWDLNVTQVDGDILCVSQFTLCGRNKKGSSLDFSRAMSPGHAKEMYEGLIGSLRDAYSVDKIKDGVFGAMMDVHIENSGPVTIILDSSKENS